MNRWLLGAVSMSVVCAAMAAAFAQEKKDTKHEHDHAQPAKAKADPRFEQIKSLAGEWVYADEKAAAAMGVTGVAVTYRVTSAGSAVIETLFPGSPHEMVSVYHLDKGVPVLTHYCAYGNQPTMKAAPAKDAGKEIVFAFAGGCNVDPAKDPHMHDMTMTVIDKDHFKAVWTHWADGKATGEPAIFDMKRKDAK